MAAILQNLDLAARLVFDRLADEADRVDVLDLAARTERRARLAHRHVHVGAQVSLFHVAVAGAEIAHDSAQLGDIGLGVLGRAQIRFRHDLHERDAGAVEVDEGHAGMPVVQRFSGVLFEMQPLDPDGHGLAVGQIDDDLALAHEWRFVLADLITRRQIGIEIVLAVEHRFQIDPRLEPETGADRLLDALLVDHRQHAGHRRVDQRHVGIGLAAERGRRGGKEFRARGHLGMDLHADHHLPVAAGAFDEFRLHRRASHERIAADAVPATSARMIRVRHPLRL